MTIRSAVLRLVNRLVSHLLVPLKSRFTYRAIREQKATRMMVNMAESGRVSVSYEPVAPGLAARQTRL